MTSISTPVTRAAGKPAAPAPPAAAAEGSGPTAFAPGEPEFPFDKVVDVHHEPGGPVHVKNKSVFIQIDGLGYAAYQMAEKRGLIPDNVLRYFDQHKFVVEPFYAGQPSTPCSEAGFMYGTDEGIPAFVFEDPKNHKTVAAAFPTVDVRQFLVDKQPGLLSEGSAYSMLLNGDAQKQVFTGQQISDFFTAPAKFKAALRHPKISLLHADEREHAHEQAHGEEKAARHGEPPPKMPATRYFLRAMKEAVKEFGVDRRAAKQTNPQGIKEKIGTKLHPLGAVSQGVLMRDVCVKGMESDIAHGVPIMWADLDGYDHAAHYYGPFAEPAFDVLKGIFQKVSEVVDAIELNPQENYHLYLVSDHGQVPSVSFASEYGAKFKDVTDQIFGKKTVHLALSAAHAQMYFKGKTGRVDLSTIEQEHPGAVQALVNHPGVGVVSAKQGANTVILTRDGSLTVSKGKIVEGDPKILEKFGHPEIVAFEIDHETQMQTSGHLIAYGDYKSTADGSGQMVNLSNITSKGYHGGVGGHQAVAFIAHSQDDPIDTKQVMGTWDLYYQFVANVTGASGAAAAPEMAGIAPDVTPIADASADPAATNAKWAAPAAQDVTQPNPTLPSIGKWMYAKTAQPADWLGMKVDGKTLREPINMVFVDEGAKTAAEATQRLEDSLHAAGYESRHVHSTGYRAWIGGQYCDQLPLTFSNHPFFESNNHGRVFGPVEQDGKFVFVAAFSHEHFDPVTAPGKEHQYGSFNGARDDVAAKMNQGIFHGDGTVPLHNTIENNATMQTGDHDGQAAVLVAK